MCQFGLACWGETEDTASKTIAFISTKTGRRKRIKGRVLKGEEERGRAEKYEVEKKDLEREERGRERGIIRHGGKLAIIVNEYQITEC